MKMTLPYPPSVNRLYATVQGRRVKSREGRIYANTAATLARMAGAKLTEKPVVVDVDFYRPRRAGDLDNTLKALLDSLTGICWRDDEQVSEIHARRFEDKHNPRVEVLIQERA